MAIQEWGFVDNCAGCCGCEIEPQASGGWVTMEDHEQAVAELVAALTESAMSLETIHEQAGRDQDLKNMQQVRGYANSRATVARAAIAKHKPAAAVARQEETA